MFNLSETAKFCHPNLSVLFEYLIPKIKGIPYEKNPQFLVLTLKFKYLSLKLNVYHQYWVLLPYMREEAFFKINFVVYISKNVVNQ